jgi:hypothetical protein
LPIDSEYAEFRHSISGCRSVADAPLTTLKPERQKADINHSNQPPVRTPHLGFVTKRWFEFIF